jgi:hypothetical protein
MDKIYFVTCIQNKKDSENFSEIKSRCWGWFKKQEDAIKYTKLNVTDMAEDGYYNYAVIEEIQEGILQLALNELWLQIGEDKNSFKECEKPEWSKGIVNWSIS